MKRSVLVCESSPIIDNNRPINAANIPFNGALPDNEEARVMPKTQMANNSGDRKNSTIGVTTGIHDA